MMKACCAASELPARVSLPSTHIFTGTAGGRVQDPQRTPVAKIIINLNNLNSAAPCTIWPGPTDADAARVKTRRAHV